MKKSDYIVFGNLEYKDYNLIQKKISDLYATSSTAEVTGSKNGYKPDLRKGHVNFLKPDQDARIFRTIQKYFLQNYNNLYKNFRFDCLPEIQYANYAQGDYFKKHADVIPSADYYRCLTMSVNLSSSREYKDGDLVIFAEENNKEKKFFLPRDKGSFVIFPAFFKHEVKKLTEGNRDALVCWYSDTFQNLQKFQKKVDSTYDKNL